MRAFHATRNSDSADEIWFTEHPAVYSAGYRQKKSHPDTIQGVPVVSVDRGGLMTYHGAGQLLCYFLFDLRRRRSSVRRFVSEIEQGVIDTLASFSVSATREAGRPGLYVAGAKVASLGLRIQQGCTRHGIAINVSTDLDPFQAIEPCGEKGRVQCSLNQLIPSITPNDLISPLTESFSAIWS